MAGDAAWARVAAIMTGALRTRKGVALGVALCYQVVERVPTTDWDEPLDGWVTAREIHILTKAR